MKHWMLALAFCGLSFAAWSEPLNPAPANALQGYDKYEFAPLAMGPPYAGDEGKEKAKDKIQGYLTAETQPIVAKWNQDAAGGTRGQSLLLEPRIEKLKVVSGGARFWAGALAGDSYVVIRLRISEQPGGKVLAEPEFYQRAAAMSGAWTIGAQDKDMLHRIVLLLNQYLDANYREAVGGATGYDPK